MSNCSFFFAFTYIGVLKGGKRRDVAYICSKMLPPSFCPGALSSFNLRLQKCAPVLFPWNLTSGLEKNNCGIHFLLSGFDIKPQKPLGMM